MAKLTQRKIAHQYLKKYGMLRFSELQKMGVSATTLNRMVKDEEVFNHSRGLYQLVSADIETFHGFAQVAKIIPNSVICLTSALNYYNITDWVPHSIWVAIEKHKWIPKNTYPPVQVIQYNQSMLADGKEIHQIEGIDVQIFGVAKTVADCFRHRNKIGIDIALEGLEKSLKYDKTTRSELEIHAKKGGVWSVMEPYIDAAVNKIPLYDWDFSKINRI